MRTVVRWGVVAIVVVHGLVHLLGAAEGLGWAEVAELSLPVSPSMGVAWLIAGILVLATAALLLASHRWWWVVGAVAAVASQAMVVAFWADAWAGTLANVVLLAAVVYGVASRGPRSLRAEYRRRVRDVLDRPGPAGVVADDDLAALPDVVATYVRRSGAVGRPIVGDVRARFHGRIRTGADAPWMTFTGEQVNTYGTRVSRLFLLDATMRGLPADVLHVHDGSSATMRAKALSLVSVVDAAGPEMDRAETVTLFNDMCVFAPAALVDAPVGWEVLDDRVVRGTYTNGDHTVSAVLTFDDDGDLANFVSDDRLRASPDGSRFTPQRWSTPLRGHRTFDGRRISAAGEGRWHAPEPEGTFTYLEIEVDDVAYNVAAARETSQDTRPVRTDAAAPPVGSVRAG